MNLIKWIPLMLLVGLLCACQTVTTPAVVTFDTKPSQSKFPMSVQLVLVEDYSSKEWSKDHWIVPLGANLTRNSTDLAQSLFESVDVVTVADPDSSANAILQPSLISTDISMGMWKWSESRFNLVHAWSLTKPDGTTIWRQDITGEGINQSGNAFTMETKMKERVEAAVRDLFQKSYDAMAASSSIRAYAQSLK